MNSKDRSSTNNFDAEILDELMQGASQPSAILYGYSPLDIAIAHGDIAQILAMIKKVLWQKPPAAMKKGLRPCKQQCGLVMNR